MRPSLGGNPLAALLGMRGLYGVYPASSSADGAVRVAGIAMAAVVVNNVLKIVEIVRRQIGLQHPVAQVEHAAGGGIVRVVRRGVTLAARTFGLDGKDFGEAGVLTDGVGLLRRKIAQVDALLHAKHDDLLGIDALDQTYWEIFRRA